jgi:DNA mismatch endonuclease (patch repair protein)
MRAVRQAHTAPELTVRRFLHRQGLRYSTHVAALPGRPDIVLPRRRSVVFVHGCFWHGHTCPHGAVQAKTNSKFWSEKIIQNQARDARKEDALRNSDWHVEVVWECQVEDAAFMHALAKRLQRR